ncbi:Uncharacterised protein [Bordetella pertussis]|nr:Uncharacterised protein [Bordetella pertussis]
MRRRRLEMVQPHVGHLGRAGQHIVGQRRGQRLAIGVVGRLFVERGADALRDAADGLAFHDHGVDHGAAILDDHVIQYLDRAGVRIHRHHGGVAGVGEAAGVDLGLVAHVHFQARRVHVGRQQLRPQVPGVGNVAGGDRFLAGPVDAVLQRHRVVGHAQHVRGDVPHARQQALACLRHRAAGHDQRARCVGAGGERRLAGIAMQHLDARHVDAENLMGDLGEGGFHALAVRVHAHAHFQPAIGRHAHRRLVEARNHGRAPGGEYRGAVRGLLGIGGHAHADAPAVGLAAGLAGPHAVDVYHLQRLAQAGRVVAAVEVLVGHIDVRHLLGLHQVLQAHFPRLAAHFARHGVHRQLDGEAHAGTPAIWHEAGFVGSHAARLAAVAAKAIGPGQVADRLVRLEPDGEGPHRIGAAVYRDPGVQRQQLAALVRIGGHFVMVLARIGAGRQVFTAVLDEAERALVGLGQPGHTELFLLQHALVAERAAHVGRHHPHAALFEVQALGQHAAYHVRHLRGADHHQLVGLVVPVGQHRLAFHGNHALPRQVDLAPDHHLGARGMFVEVAVGVQGDEHVVAPVLVHQVRRGLLRAGHVGIDRQVVIIDFHQLGMVFRLGARRRERHGHRLADEAHLAAGQRRLNRGLVGRQGRIGRDIARIAHHRAQHDLVAHALGHPHIGNARMRQRTAQECHLAQPGHGHVGHEVALAMQMARVLLAGNARPDSLP